MSNVSSNFPTHVQPTSNRCPTVQAKSTPHPTHVRPASASNPRRSSVRPPAHPIATLPPAFVQAATTVQLTSNPSPPCILLCSSPRPTQVQPMSTAQPGPNPFRPFIQPLPNPRSLHVQPMSNACFPPSTQPSSNPRPAHVQHVPKPRQPCQSSSSLRTQPAFKSRPTHGPMSHLCPTRVQPAATSQLASNPRLPSVLHVVCGSPMRNVSCHRAAWCVRKACDVHHNVACRRLEHSIRQRIKQLKLFHAMFGSKIKAVLSGLECWRAVLKNNNNKAANMD